MTGPAPGGAQAPARTAHDFDAFLRQLHEAIAGCRASGGALAVLFVDYDIVARLDSARGFEAGNAAHWCLVDRMRNDVLRSQDALGEVARGQMACALLAIQSPGVARLAANKAMRVLGAPIALEDTQVHAQPAFGIALYPQHGDSPDLLLKHARIACRNARDRHERIAEYSAEQDDPRARALFLENRLRHALADETLALSFQPRIELFTQRVVGVECLLHSPGGEPSVALPSDVLASIESGELVTQVVAWLLHAALRNGADFLYNGLNLAISLKVPARCLRAPDLPELVDRALHTWPVQRGQLVLAFTGLAALGAQADVVAALGRLRKLGVKLAMDSLGSGDATLFDLASLPFDELRLPLRYLPGLEAGARPERLLRAWIELAKQVGLTTVVEGVDDEAQAARVGELGCQQALGTHFGAPLDAAAFVAAYEGRG